MFSHFSGFHTISRNACFVAQAESELQYDAATQELAVLIRSKNVCEAKRNQKLKQMAIGITCKYQLFFFLSVLQILSFLFFAGGVVLLLAVGVLGGLWLHRTGRAKSLFFAHSKRQSLAVPGPFYYIIVEDLYGRKYL